MSEVTKSIDDNFADWEAHVFGFGYGSGEEHVLPLIQRFLDLMNGDGSYDYLIIEAALTPTVAWLLINALCHCDILEYGTSPRYGWLTTEGRELREYMLSKTADQLVELVTERGDDYMPCSPGYCNCGPDGFEKGRVCRNPFWSSR